VIPHHGSLTGLLASDVESYARSMVTTLAMSYPDRADMQRESVRRFTDEVFESAFVEVVDGVVPAV